MPRTAELESLRRVWSTRIDETTEPPRTMSKIRLIAYSDYL